MIPVIVLVLVGCGYRLAGTGVNPVLENVKVLVVVPFGMVIAGMVATLMPEDVVRDIVAWIGDSRADSRPWVLATIGVGVATVFGPLVGSFVGATTVVARILRGALFFRAR